MKIYLAGPFFNEVQVTELIKIENVFEDRRIQIYSPRLHSGSHRMTPEQRKNRSNWDSVYRSNIDAMHSCDIMLAILDYQLPKGREVHVVDNYDGYTINPITGHEMVDSLIKLQIPDTGTVFEMGYFNALQKPVIGYVSQMPKSMNLMLTHGVHGVVEGAKNLLKFLTPGTPNYPDSWTEMLAQYTADRKYDYAENYRQMGMMLDFDYAPLRINEVI